MNAGLRALLNALRLHRQSTPCRKAGPPFLCFAKRRINWVNVLFTLFTPYGQRPGQR
jgi:hypothetical protein